MKGKSDCLKTARVTQKCEDTIEIYRVLIFPLIALTHRRKKRSTPNAPYQVSRSSAFWFRRRWFLRFLSYMGMAAILVMWPGPFEQTFVPQFKSSKFHMKFDIDWPCGFWGRDVYRVWTTDEGRRRPTYPISSPKSLWLRWAKKGCRFYCIHIFTDYKKLLIVLIMNVYGMHLIGNVLVVIF